MSSFGKEAHVATVTDMENQNQSEIVWKYADTFHINTGTHVSAIKNNRAAIRGNEKTAGIKDYCFPRLEPQRVDKYYLRCFVCMWLEKRAAARRW